MGCAASVMGGVYVLQRLMLLSVWRESVRRDQWQILMVTLSKTFWDFSSWRPKNEMKVQELKVQCCLKRPVIRTVATQRWHLFQGESKHGVMAFCSSNKQFVFSLPRLKRCQKPSTVQPLAVLRRQHNQLGAEKGYFFTSSRVTPDCIDNVYTDSNRVLRPRQREKHK